MTVAGRPPARGSALPFGSLLVLLVAVLISCGPAGAPSEPPGPSPEAAVATSEEHVREIESWRDERRSSLLSEDGWFTLVGLYWLETGVNRFGSAPGADLVFPPGTPAEIGTLELRDGAVTLTPAAGSGLRAGGEPVTGPLTLAVDTTGEPTEVELGTVSFYVIERGGRYGVRVKDSASPARSAFEGLDYFPLDPAWRVEARLEPEDGATVAVPNVLGQVEDARAPGTLVFRAPSGEELRLTPMQEAPGDELFVVFGDATNGVSTYGGGRFLYAEAPADDGRVVLDFNRAYNPPCAFTPYATCPLPPEVNKLSLSIEAGEKSYAGEIPH